MDEDGIAAADESLDFFLPPKKIYYRHGSVDLHADQEEAKEAEMHEARKRPHTVVMEETISRYSPPPKRPRCTRAERDRTQLSWRRPSTGIHNSQRGRDAQGQKETLHSRHGGDHTQVFTTLRRDLSRQEKVSICLSVDFGTWLSVDLAFCRPGFL